LRQECRQKGIQKISANNWYGRFSVKTAWRFPEMGAEDEEQAPILNDEEFRMLLEISKHISSGKRRGIQNINQQALNSLHNKNMIELGPEHQIERISDIGMATLAKKWKAKQ